MAGVLTRALLPASLSACALFSACPTEEPPPARGVAIGTVVGEVFDKDGSSIGGASVEVYGTPAKAVSEAGKSFVLGGIPMGSHMLTIVHEGLNRAKRVEVALSQPYQTVNLDEEDTTLGEAATLFGSVSVADGSPVGTTVYLVGGNGRQQALAGDDGSYEVGGLPSGAVQIAFSKIGHETKVVELALAEGDNDAGDVALATSSAGNLTLRGVVKRVESTEHRGITVLLNGGEQVVASDGNGNYQFSDLSPGLYSIKAQAPGFKTMELAQVALTADGEAHGLVAGWLAPGVDEPTVSDVDLEERGLVVRIQNPLSGARFEEGSLVPFLAQGEDRGAELPGSALRWSRVPTSDPGSAPVTMGTGSTLTVDDLPVGTHSVTVVGTASDGAVSLPATIVVEVYAFDYGLSVAIAEPTDNSSYVEAAPIEFRANAATTRNDVVVNPSTDVTWGYRPAADATAALTALVDDTSGSDTGQKVTVSSLPVGQWSVVASVAVAGSEAVQSAPIEITVMPLEADFVPVVVGTQTVDVAQTGPTEWDLAMYQGQVSRLSLSVPHPTAGELASTATWSSDTGIAFAGESADFATLPVGTHVFTVVVQNGDDTFTFTITAIVLDFAFTVAIIGPRLPGIDDTAPDGPPYFTTFGLPLRATFSHPFQTAFTAAKARWYAVDGDSETYVANGLVSRTFSLPPGQGVLRFELEDEAGNVASATTEYVLQQITFTASFVEPSAGTVVLEGTPITASVDFAHTLVDSGEIPASQLTVHYFSSINGLLADATGKSEFAVDERPALVGLTFGNHVLTASVNDGAQPTSRIATDRRGIVVKSPGVAATLVSPAPGTVVFPGVTNVSFNAQVSFDPAVQPLFRWKMDGQEFAADWDDYGADETNPARATVNLGVFDSGASTGPFADARWKDSDTQHDIELFVRLPEVDDQYAGACVNIPNKAVCIQLSIDVVLGDPNVCPSSSTMNLDGVQEVWSGVKRLNCYVQLQGGAQLTILPGTRVVVDANTAFGIRIQDGAVTAGALGGAPVVMEVQGAAAGQNKWEGFDVWPYNGAPTHLALYNTVIRHTDYAIQLDSDFYRDADHSLVMHDVTFEMVAGALDYGCADEMTGIVVRDAYDYAFREGTNGHHCELTRTYSDIVVQEARGLLSADGPGTIIIDGVEVYDSIESAIDTGGYNPEAIVVRDSLFDGVGNSADDAAVRSDYECVRIEMVGNTVRNATGGFYGSYCSNTYDPYTRVTIARNVFENVTRPIYDEATGNGDIEVHLNSFTGAATYFQLAYAGQDLAAQGNFIGAAGQAGTPGATLAALPPGTLPNLPRISDYFDSAGNDRVVRVANPLAAAATSPDGLPIAYIAQPESTRPYKVDGGSCLPLVAAAPEAVIEVLQPGVTASGTKEAACWWYVLDDAAAPDGGRAPLSFDAERCADSAELAAGERAILLECEHTDGGRIDQHVVRVKVDNGVWSGPLASATTTWSGTVELAGDVIVPAGKTLIVSPGTTVKLRTTDVLKHKRNIDYPGSIEGNANVNFGLREKIDLFVDGTLAVGALEGAETSVSSTAALQAKGLWGGIRVGKTGSVTLENVSFASATDVTHATYDPGDFNVIPAVSWEGVTVTSSAEGHRGTCPSLFTDVDMSFVDIPVADAYCPSSFTVSNSVFTSVGRSDLDAALFWLHSHPQASLGSQVVLDNVVVDRTWGNRLGGLLYLAYQNRFTQVAIYDVTVADISYLVWQDVWSSYDGESHTIDIQRVDMNNFQRLLGGTGDQIDVLGVSDSSFVDGYTLFEYTRDARIMSVQDSLIRDVDYPFLGCLLGNEINTLTFTGNQVENAVDIFHFRMSGAGGSVFSPVMTHNNFIGTTGDVWLLDNYNLTTNDTFADLTDNWWGTAVESEIQALINDAQIDGAAPDYTPWAATMHTDLTVPTP